MFLSLSRVLVIFNTSTTGILKKSFITYVVNLWFPLVVRFFRSFAKLIELGT